MTNGNRWIETTVQGIAADVPNALVTGPFGSKISSRFFQSTGVPVIRGSNLSEDIDHRLIHDDLVFVSLEKAEEFKRSKARRGDLIFTCWGTIGQVGLIDDRSTFDEYIISNKQMKLTPDKRKADSLFLYYLFSSPLMSSLIKGQRIGSSVPGFNLGQLKSLHVKLPPLSEQYAIAYILGTIDDKIDLNRKMNETLEKIAEGIFKSWFINFDPVYSKMKGDKLFGLSDATATLFPNSFEDSEMGNIPRGWRIKSLGELINLAYGKALKGETRRSGNFPVFGSNGQVGWHDEKLVTGPGVVVGRKGNPGVVTWVPTDFFPIDTTFYVVPTNECHSLYFSFFVLRTQGLASLGADSAVPGLNRNMAYLSKQVVPPPDVLHAFDSCIRPLFEQISCNDEESRILVSIRDALLPKLLSGELRVEKTEQKAVNHA